MCTDLECLGFLAGSLEQVVRGELCAADGEGDGRADLLHLHAGHLRPGLVERYPAHMAMCYNGVTHMVMVLQWCNSRCNDVTMV